MFLWGIQRHGTMYHLDLGVKFILPEGSRNPQVKNLTPNYSGENRPAVQATQISHIRPAYSKDELIIQTSKTHKEKTYHV